MPEASETAARRHREQGDLREENLKLREEVLTLRDAQIGTEARLAEALGRLRVLETEMMRYQEIEQLYRSRTGHFLQSYHRLRRRLRRTG